MKNSYFRCMNLKSSLNVKVKTTKKGGEKRIVSIRKEVRKGKQIVVWKVVRNNDFNIC